MKKIAVSLLLIIFFSACAPAALLADKIICENGTIYEGVIIAENAEVVIMEIPVYPIKIQVYKGAVKDIRKGSREENNLLKKEILKIKKERGYIE